MKNKLWWSVGSKGIRAFKIIIMKHITHTKENITCMYSLKHKKVQTHVFTTQPCEGVSSIMFHLSPAEVANILISAVNHFFAILYGLITYVNVLKLYMILFYF